MVEVIPSDATAARALRALDVVVASAGVPRPPEAWLSALGSQGRMMVPLTGEDGMGITLHLARFGTRVEAASLRRCGFFHCAGARRPEEARALSRALSEGMPELAELRRDAPAEDAWFAGEGFWLSRA